MNYIILVGNFEWCAIPCGKFRPEYYRIAHLLCSVHSNCFTAVTPIHQNHNRANPCVITCQLEAAVEVSIVSNVVYNTAVPTVVRITEVVGKAVEQRAVAKNGQI